jgi:peptide/nickel transport system substrate-binding protein
VDKRKGIENTASFKSNGTGPVPAEGAPAVDAHGARAQLNYWGQVDGNVDEVVFTPIGQRRDARGRAAVRRDRRDGARAAAGRGARQGAGKFTVLQGPELRTIFLGMDQRRDELLSSA